MYSLELSLAKLRDTADSFRAQPEPPARREDIVLFAGGGEGAPGELRFTGYIPLLFAYQKRCEVLSAGGERFPMERPGDCLAGRPDCVCELRGGADCGAVGVLIRKEYFWRKCLPAAAFHRGLLAFFLTPEAEADGAPFLPVSLPDGQSVRKRLDLMAVLYANDMPGSQEVLATLLPALLEEIDRQYRLAQQPAKTLAGEIAAYVADHIGTVSREALAARFSYHENTISARLREETGQSFSKYLLSLRMERALLLLRATTLTTEEISAMLGYSNCSNFFKAFRAYYGTSPRKYES